MKKISLILTAAICIAAVAAHAQQPETKFAAHATASAVTFGPGQGRTVVVGLNTTTDLEDSVVKFYARSGAPLAPTADTALSGTIVALATGHGLTTGDHVAYVHANGTVNKTTLAGHAAGNVTLTAALTVAGATGDRLYKLTEQGRIVVGGNGTTSGVNDHVNLTGKIFATPIDSPLYVLLNSTSASVLQVTVER